LDLEHLIVVTVVVVMVMPMVTMITIFRLMSQKRGEVIVAEKKKKSTLVPTYLAIRFIA
jgi:flagellar basal body-associated protein FliL